MQHPMDQSTGILGAILKHHLAAAIGDSFFELASVEQAVLVLLVAAVEEVVSTPMHSILDELPFKDVSLMPTRELVNANAFSQIVFELSFVLEVNLFAKFGELLAFQVYLID